MKRNSRSKILIVILLLTLLTGCWDREEIEELGIILGVSIDAKDKNELKKGIQPIITLTNQIVIPMGSESQGGTAAEKQPYVNSTLKGESIYGIVNKYATINSRPPYYQHMKVIVLSSKATKLINLQKIMNFFLRDPEIRRTVKVVIAKDSAKNILSFKPKQERIPALEILSLVENTEMTNEMVQHTSLGNISEKLSANTSFIIQRVEREGRGVELAGAAIIEAKSNKMVGWLSSDELRGLNWIIGHGEGGIVHTEMPKTSLELNMDVEKITSHINPTFHNGKLSFTIHVEAHGNLVESWVLKEDAFKKAYIEKIERFFSKEIKKLVYQGLKKTQKKYKVDVAGFGDIIRIEYPTYWSKVKNKWDKVFSKVPIDVYTQVEIRRFGSSGKKMGK